MQHSGVTIAEPFASALSNSAARQYVDHAASTPVEYFSRALTRMAVGLDGLAREDLQSASSELAAACEVECALLDMREGKHLDASLASVRKVADAAPPDSALAARAWHVVGLACEKRRQLGEAFEALARSAAVYEALGDLDARARVFDSLGLVELGRGQIESSLHYFGTSLARKSFRNDRYGMALTLGNMGRAQLQAGRFQEAIECFEQDLSLSIELQDVIGQARMLEDIGRAHLGRGDCAAASAKLRECIAFCDLHGLQTISYFALKDLAVCLIEQAQLSEADEVLRQAAQRKPSSDPYFELLIAEARGRLQLARQQPAALDTLSSAVTMASQLQLPDLEIALRLALAEALLAARQTANAERCLIAAGDLAAQQGMARFLPAIGDAMTRLGIVVQAVEEHGADLHLPGPAAAVTPGSGYLLREPLGAGAYGDVYRAYDSARFGEVAVKILQLSDLYDTAQRSRLLESARAEIRTASRVRHPGVARVYALGTTRTGAVYIVQQYIQGRSLRAEMKTSAGLARILIVLEQLAHALSALHEVRVVHRDLKPENILLTPAGLPVLVDFGIAILADQRLATSPRILGTLPYMAPEQAQGKAVQPAADLYALGVVAYEWLTGVRPLEPQGSTISDMVRDLARRKPLRVADLRPDVPRALEDLVMALLEKKPRRRPAAATEVAKQLRLIRLPKVPTGDRAAAWHQ